MSKNNSGKWAMGALLGGLIGFAAGILTAPKSGKETRKDIKDEATKDIAVAEKQLRKVKSELEKTIETAKVEIKKLRGEARAELTVILTKAEKASEKAHDILVAVKAGNADDEDLQKAIKEADKAYEHLRNYLAKS